MDRSNSAAKFDLANSKVEVFEIDIDKLKTVPADLNELSNLEDNDFVKKTVYEKLVTTFNAIDTRIFVLKTQYVTDKSGLQNKIYDADKKISGTSLLLL